MRVISPFKFKNGELKVIEITPVEIDLSKVLGGKNSVKHVGLKVKLEDGTKHILELGPNYGQTVRIKTTRDGIAPVYNKGKGWKKTHNKIIPPKEETLENVVNHLNSQGQYNVVSNNCIDGKDSVLRLVGADPNVAKSKFEKVITDIKPIRKELDEFKAGWKLNAGVAVTMTCFICPNCGASGEKKFKKENETKIFTCANCDANLVLQSGKVALKSQVSGYVAKKVTQKIISETAKKASTKVVSTAMTKAVATPYFIAGDVAELGARAIIKDPTAQEVVGTTVGVGAYAGIGAAMGGPVGAGVGIGIYTLGRVIGGIMSLI